MKLKNRKKILKILEGGGRIFLADRNIYPCIFVKKLSWRQNHYFKTWRFNYHCHLYSIFLKLSLGSRLEPPLLNLSLSAENRSPRVSEEKRSAWPTDLSLPSGAVRFDLGCKIEMILGSMYVCMSVTICHVMILFDYREWYLIFSNIDIVICWRHFN